MPKRSEPAGWTDFAFTHDRASQDIDKRFFQSSWWLAAEYLDEGQPEKLADALCAYREKEMHTYLAMKRAA